MTTMMSLNPPASIARTATVNHTHPAPVSRARLRCRLRAQQRLRQPATVHQRVEWAATISLRMSCPGGHGIVHG